MTEYTKEALTSEINTDIRKIAFKILRNVVVATPVDTGRARGNWQIGVDRAKSEVLTVDDKSGSVSIGKGVSVLRGVGDFKSIWITNNLPYIGKLNDGSSEQAPKKFVETSIVRALND